MPATEKEIQEVLQEIKIGPIYEEYFFSDYDTDIPTIYEALGEYENIYELNYLAECIDNLDKYTKEKYYAVAEYITSHEGRLYVQDYINLAHEENLDNFMWNTDISSEYDLGYYYAHECGLFQADSTTSQDFFERYFDYESYGRDLYLEGQFGFLENSIGMIERIDNNEVEYYSGLEDLPDISNNSLKTH